MTKEQSDNGDCNCFGMDRDDGLHEGTCPVYRRRTKETNVDPTFTELDYIADLLYQHHAKHVQRYTAGVRWWCHRSDANDGREHWRQVAKERYEEWAAGERKMLEEQSIPRLTEYRNE